jgi:hypothetical protein
VAGFSEVSLEWPSGRVIALAGNRPCSKLVSSSFVVCKSPQAGRISGGFPAERDKLIGGLHRHPRVR